VNNYVGYFEYSNIPNFTSISLLWLGVQQRMALGGDSFYVTRTVRDNIRDTTYYLPDWETYDNQTLFGVFCVQKFQYEFGFEGNYPGWKSVLNPLSRLHIFPQYKVSYEKRVNNSLTDPRDGWIPGKDDIGASKEWLRFSEDNMDQLISTGILRVNYDLGNKTAIQYGFQVQESFNLLAANDNFWRRVQTLQLMSRDNLAGYSISLIIGFNLRKQVCNDHHEQSPFIRGGECNCVNTRFFIRVFAGN
jgi:hypothetical protein